MKKYDKYMKKALKLGATDAKIINPESVVTSAWVRWKCRYGCDGYNSGLCCPPNTPNYKETRELLDCYKNALLIHVKSDYEHRKDLTDMAATLERDIFLDGYHKAFALGCGPCNLCGECSMNVCRHPEKARPSLESCGVDVFTTARNNGFFIESLKDTSCVMNRYALVLIE